MSRSSVSQTNRHFIPLPPAPVRIFLAILWVCVIALWPDTHWRSQWISFILLLGLTIGFRCSWRALARRFLVLWPFVALMAVGLLGQTDWLTRLLNLWLKATLSLWALWLLLQVTPWSELIPGLKTLRLPRVAVELFAFWGRYFAVVTDEWHRLRLAHRARTLRWNRRREFKLLAQSLGTLFIRAYERAERVHQAMLARGYRPS